MFCCGMKRGEEADFVGYLCGRVCYLSKAMLRVLRCVETMGDVSLWAVFSCDGCMAARREGASRGDNTKGSVYTTCFSWSTSITMAPSSTGGSTQVEWEHKRRLLLN